MANSDTEMDDATSQNSNLNTSQFTDLPHASSPDSTPTTESRASSGRGSKKRTQTAMETWAYAKKLKPNEEIQRDHHGNRIWSCNRCSWESASLTSVRNHLSQRHGIKIDAQQPRVRTKGQAKLEQILQKQGEKQQAQANEREQKILQEAINHKAFDESLLQLIINNNLPHKSVEYPELYSLIMSVNYMAAEVYPKSRAMIPKKVDLSFLRTKAKIKQHLHSALSEIHLACDVWTTEHKKKAFLAVVAHFVDSKGKSRKALLGLPRL